MAAHIRSDDPATAIGTLEGGHLEWSGVSAPGVRDNEQIVGLFRDFFYRIPIDINDPFLKRRRPAYFPLGGQVSVRDAQWESFLQRDPEALQVSLCTSATEAQGIAITIVEISVYGDHLL